MKNLLFFLFILITASLSAQNMEDSIRKKVDQNMEIQLSKIPVGSEKQFGFASREEFSRCTAGTPIRVLTLDSDYSLVELNEWRIPILKDGKSRVLFTARINKDTIEIVDLGGASLAAELQTVLNNNLKVHFMLRLFALQIDFVANCADKTMINQSGFLPLQSAKAFIKNTAKEKDKAAYSLSEVKQIFKENIR